MPTSCWHARFLALPLPLQRMAVEMVSAPAATGPLRQQRRFSASRPRDAMAQKKKAPARPARAQTAAGRGKKTKTFPPSPPAPPAPPKQAAKKRGARPLPAAAQDQPIRALCYLPPAAPASAALPAAGADDGETDAVRVAPTPAADALDRATRLFVRPPPAFLYSAPRFLHLPVNTRMPEICILGRSNVGKSTLLNALAGLESGGKAGRSHGARPGRLGLAITSTRAGCTTMMNGYGFGPPLRPAQAPVFERLEREEREQPEAAVRAGKGAVAGVASRSQRRAQRPGEPAPAHSLVLIDMPGYGFLSRAEWGAEIAKYLERRATLRGAVLLVDAVAGLKDADRQVLGMLRDARVRTTVVLTKADKLLPPPLLRAPRRVASLASLATPLAEPEPEPAFRAGASDGERTLRAACLAVWDALRDTERAAWVPAERRGGGGAAVVPWMEGQGWAPEICVTGAGDPRGGGFGVAGARLAICRMAGLVPEPRTKPKTQHKAARPEPAGTAAPASPASPTTVVPFDQIQWSETTSAANLDQAAELRLVAEQERAPRKARRQRPQASEAPPQDEPAEDGAAAEAQDASPASKPSGGRRRPWKSAAARRRVG